MQIYPQITQISADEDKREETPCAQRMEKAMKSLDKFLLFNLCKSA